MKYCSHCGNEVMDEAEICPKCGCRLSEAKVVSTPKEPAGSSGPALGLGIASIACAIISFLIFGWLALVGFGLGIGAIVSGAKHKTATKAKVGLGLGIGGTVVGAIAIIIWIQALMLLSAML